MTSATDCARFAPLLDALVDGELDDTRASAVRGHLRGCLVCTRDLEGRRALLEAARSLEAAEPPAALWQGIEARLGAAEVQDSERPRLWWWWQEQKRRLAFGTLATVGAAAVILMMARPWLAERRDAQAPTASAPLAAPASPSATDPYEEALHEIARVDADYRKAIDELHVIVRKERGRWPREVATSFDENLAVIDAAVARQRSVAQQAPGDPGLQDALFASYQKQIDFLQEAVVRGEVRP